MQKIAKKVKKIQNNNLSYPVGLWYAIIIIGFTVNVRNNAIMRKWGKICSYSLMRQQPKPRMN